MKVKMILYLLFPAIIALSLGVQSVQQNNNCIDHSLYAQQNDRCSIENTTFLGGEEIVYKVYYNWSFFWTAAGLVHFRVTESDSMYHVRVVGSTRGFYDNFYRVRDTFETVLDKETLLPTMFTRSIREGKYRHYNKFIFDQESKTVISYEGKSRETVDTTEVSYADCMLDIISVLYYVRNMNFDNLVVGDTFPVDVYLEEIYPLQVKIIEKNVIQKVKGSGKFITHVFQPQLIAGEVFNEKDQMSIYISADSNKIPVLIESPLSVGHMKAVLLDYKGLKFDLDAKVKG